MPHTRDARDAGAFVCMLDEFTALVQQLRADDLTSRNQAALRRVLHALVDLTGVPAGSSAAE
jgi:hypothetical protein